MKQISILLILLAGFIQTGCAAVAVTSAAVGTTVYAGKTVAKAAVGTGKLVVGGAGATAKVLTPSNANDPEFD